MVKIPVGKGLGVCSKGVLKQPFNYVLVDNYSKDCHHFVGKPFFGLAVCFWRKPLQPED